MKWTTIQLGDVIDVKHGFAFKSSHFSDAGQYILLTPGNCFETGGLKLKGDKEKYFTGDFPDEFLLGEGDLLVVMTDLINTAPILGGSFFIPDSNRFLHNQRLGLVQITDSQRIDKKYLHYLLNTPNYRAQVRGSASGATVRHTSPNRIKQCSARIPRDLASQRRIADFLSAYDNLIENNRRRISLLEDASRQLHEEWFVRLRFPGREHTPIVDGCPTTWQWRSLESVCALPDGIQTGPFGSQLHQADYTEDGVPVVMPKDLLGFQISTGDIARVPEFIAEKLSRHRMIENDIVFGRRGEIGRRAFISKRRVGWLCGTGCLRIRPNPDLVEPRYLFDSLGSPLTAGTIVNRAKGATMPNLNASVMKSVPVLIPPLSLQQIYADYIRPMVELSETLGEQSRNLQISRDLLLPQVVLGGAIAVE